ncbi:YfiR family protein [Pseudoduganella sp. OTU4001]|uniref:YfiR family protein n=1 Tax=Pseudoduganella sp. OTU4001 TaxID=3043854 RepID=UPI00313BC1DC
MTFRYALLLAACWPSTLTAQAAVSKEQIKAALVFNFMKFTEWPAEQANGPLVLCLANADRRMEAAFGQVNGRTIDSRVIQVRPAPGADVGACHLLFIQDSTAHELLERVAASYPRVLTVGDQDDFTEAGGAIGLVEQNGRVHFKVNMDMLRKGNYKVSSQLLKLAINLR